MVSLALWLKCKDEIDLKLWINLVGYREVHLIAGEGGFYFADIL